MVRKQKGFFDKLTKFEKTQYSSETEIQAYQEENYKTGKTCVSVLKEKL